MKSGEVNLVASEKRVAPIKKQTKPRQTCWEKPYLQLVDPILRASTSLTATPKVTLWTDLDASSKRSTCSIAVEQR